MNKTRKSSLFPIVMIGAVWGIFEATVGYLLHLLPVSVGFLVWYPVAVFFLLTAYRMAGTKQAVFATAALAAAVKLLNLLLPGRVDRVINPAVSILFEGAAVLAALLVFERVAWTRRAGGRLAVSLGMNTLWRALYLGYLAFLVPDWMREASVLQSTGKLIRFIVIDNLCSSTIVFIGLLLAAWLAERGRGPVTGRIQWPGLTQAAVAITFLALNIVLQMVL